MNNIKYYIVILIIIAGMSFITIHKVSNKDSVLLTSDAETLPEEKITETTNKRNNEIIFNHYAEAEDQYFSDFAGLSSYYDQINLMTQYYSKSEILCYYGLDNLSNNLDTIVNEVFQNQLSYLPETVIFFINKDDKNKIYGVYTNDNLVYDRNIIKYSNLDSESEKALDITIEKSTNVSRPGSDYLDETDEIDYEKSIISGYEVILVKCGEYTYRCDIVKNNTKISIKTHELPRDLMIEFIEKIITEIS